MSTKKRPFSPVDEFIKTFNEMSARYSRNELWYNYIDMHAIALANTTHEYAGFFRSEQVAYLPSKRPMLRCRMSSSGWVQCDARAVGTH